MMSMMAQNHSASYGKHWGFMPNPQVAREIASLDAQKDCQRIVYLLTAYEFPWDITRSLEVALFYTYGSDTVSALLDRTGEFKDHGQKRYDDTRLLIAHFMESGWDGEVGSRALARINKTHGNYRIPQEDFLFVLWTFIEFPLRWTAEFSWRPMTAHEQLAWFNFWSEIGRRMGLVDIPTSKPAFDAYVTRYRQQHFIPAEASARVAEATLHIIRGWLPSPLHGFVAPAVTSLIDEPDFLAAVHLKPAPKWMQVTVKGSLKALARVKRVYALGRYPTLLADAPNRTYPGNRYDIDALEPAHLQRRKERV